MKLGACYLIESMPLGQVNCESFLLFWGAFIHGLAHTAAGWEPHSLTHTHAGPEREIPRHTRSFPATQPSGKVTSWGLFQTLPRPQQFPSHTNFCASSLTFPCICFVFCFVRLPIVFARKLLKIAKCWKFFDSQGRWVGWVISPSFVLSSVSHNYSTESMFYAKQVAWTLLRSKGSG